MQRVALVGPAGSGKTTFGRRLGAAASLPLVELDGIYHQPGWEELAAEPFRRRVDEIVRTERWIIDGNYSVVRDLVWARADTVVCFDIGRIVVLRRVLARTLRRAITRETLWNGNREPLTNFYRWDPNKNVIRWAWVKYPEYSTCDREAEADPAFAHMASFLERVHNMWAIGCHIASGLEFLHSHKHVHRDLKPANGMHFSIYI